MRGEEIGDRRRTEEREGEKIFVISHMLVTLQGCHRHPSFSPALAVLPNRRAFLPVARGSEKNGDRSMLRVRARACEGRLTCAVPRMYSNAHAYSLASPNPFRQSLKGRDWSGGVRGGQSGRAEGRELGAPRAHVTGFFISGLI